PDQEVLRRTRRFSFPQPAVSARRCAVNRHGHCAPRPFHIAIARPGPHQHLGRWHVGKCGGGGVKIGKQLRIPKTNLQLNPQFQTPKSARESSALRTPSELRAHDSGRRGKTVVRACFIAAHFSPSPGILGKRAGGEGRGEGGRFASPDFHEPPNPRREVRTPEARDFLEFGAWDLELSALGEILLTAVFPVGKVTARLSQTSGVLNRSRSGRPEDFIGNYD